MQRDAIVGCLHSYARWPANGTNELVTDVPCVTAPCHGAVHASTTSEQLAVCVSVTGRAGAASGLGLMCVGAALP